MFDWFNLLRETETLKSRKTLSKSGSASKRFPTRSNMEFTSHSCEFLNTLTVFNFGTKET